MRPVAKNWSKSKAAFDENPRDSNNHPTIRILVQR